MNAGPLLLLTTVAVFGATGSPLEGLGHGRRPARIQPYWLGLGHGVERAPAAGVVALKPPVSGRVRIAGGRFTMGSTTAEMLTALTLCAREPFGTRCVSEGEDVGPWIRAEGHVHQVTLSDYELDRTEVTVERYARCVAAGACAPPSFPGGDARYDRPTLPVTHVRWEDAQAYCAWTGGRLPTEAEWEHAARGASGHTFPWGEIYNTHLANHGAWADDPTDGTDGYVGLAPVGSFPDGATASGLLDMAGNAAEWVSDFYDRDDEGYGYSKDAAVNPKGPPFGPYGHVVRGGSYRDAAHWLRAAARRASPLPSREVGFRCAYDVARRAVGPKSH